MPNALNPDETVTESPETKPWYQRPKTLLKGLGAGLAVVVLLGLLLVFGLNTGPGRQMIAGIISSQKFEDGLKVTIKRIDGSLYGRIRVTGLSLSDTKGVFLSVPQATLDWRPLDYLGKHVHIKELSAPDVSFSRLPILKAKKAEPPKGPLLPDLNIDIDQLRLEHVSIGPEIMGPALGGKGSQLRLASAAHLKDGEVTLTGDLASHEGDKVLWTLKSRPDANQLELAAEVIAPKTGVIVALGGLPDGLEARLQGKGSWKDWRGALGADSLGAKPQALTSKALARLEITAQNGQFHITGPLTPGSFVPEAARALIAPRIDSDVTFKLKDRAAEIKGHLKTGAADIEAEGGFDAGRNRFEAFTLTLKLLQPQAVMRELNGKDVTLDMFLEGPFNDLKADYELKAAALGWEKTGVTRLWSKGSARLQGPRLTSLVEFKLAEIDGLGPEAAALLKSASGRGDISFEGEKLSLKSLKLNSPAIGATGEYAADFKAGSQKGSVDAQLKGYDLKDVGRFIGSLKGKFAMTAKGAPMLEADLDLSSQKVTQAALREQLGEKLTLNARIRTEGFGGGDIRLKTLNLRAPKLTFQADGVYRRNGAVEAKGEGISALYGPVQVAVAGTGEKPVVNLVAAKPGFGVGVKDLKALLRFDLKTQPRLDVIATGNSDYGPLSTDTGVGLGAPLSLDIHQAEAGGIGFTGRLEQSKAGPFAGRLTLNKGLTGQVDLLAAGADQAANIDITAKEAKLLGAQDLYVGRALIKGRVVMAAQPKFSGDIQMADMRYQTLRLQKGRARFDLVGDQGKIQFVADATETKSRLGGQVMHMALNAASEEASGSIVWRVNASGTVNDAPLRLKAPALLRRNMNGWTLEPATLLTDSGSLTVNGQFGGQSGQTTQLEARLDDFDMALINTVAPSLGFSGITNGTISYQSDAAGTPSGRARLNVDRFSHAGLESLSSQVSMKIDAALTPGAKRGSISTVILQGDNQIGHIEAQVSPRAGATGLEALLDGPVSGGIRYNGPSGPLFSMTGVSGQSLSGAIAIGADISGTLAAPRLNGLMRAENLTYDNEAFGTRLTQLKLEGRFTNDRLDLTRLDGRVGEGTVAISGWLSLAADKGFPMAVKVALDNARLARSDALSSVVTGTLNITHDGPDQGLIEGELNLPQTRYEVTPPKSAEIAALDGVRRKGEQLVVAPSSLSTLPNFALNIRIRADNQIFLNGMGLQSEWRARLALIGSTRNPRISGQLEALRGTYDFAGRSFAIDDGEIDFTNGDPLNPAITLHASTEVKDLTGKITVTGAAQRPEIRFSSSPSLPEDEVLSRVLFGQSITNLSATEALQLASAVNSLRGSGISTTSRLRNFTGIDRLRVVGADTATGRGTSVAAGKYLTGNIYVEVVTDAKGFMTTQFDIALSRALSLLSQTGSANETSVKLRYSKDY